MTEYCAVIGPALYRASQQTAVKEVTRPLLPNGVWPRETRKLMMEQMRSYSAAPASCNVPSTTGEGFSAETGTEVLNQQTSAKGKQSDDTASQKRPRFEEGRDGSSKNGAVGAQPDDQERGKSPLITEEAWSDEEGGERVRVKACMFNQFFAELDIDYSRQRRRLLEEGIKVR